VNCEKAVILREKLARYSLDPEHIGYPHGKSSGRDKARVFKAVLGFDPTSWELLRDRILEELPFHEAAEGRSDEFGQRYVVNMPIEGINGNTAIVLVAWIVRTGTDFPVLVSARCLTGA
jgi:hypothetical protein